MRTASIWAFLLFSASLACGRQREEPTSNPPAPEAVKVSFCDLYQHPESYSGKLVQVHAAIYGIKHMGIEDAAFPGTRCESYIKIDLWIPKGQSEPRAPIRNSSLDNLEKGVKSGNRVIADIQGFFEFRTKHTRRNTMPSAQLVLFKTFNVITLPVPRK